MKHRWGEHGQKVLNSKWSATSIYPYWRPIRRRPPQSTYNMALYHGLDKLHRGGRCPFCNDLHSPVPATSRDRFERHSPVSLPAPKQASASRTAALGYFLQGGTFELAVRLQPGDRAPLKTDPSLALLS
jgi:hypothetical protein